MSWWLNLSREQLTREALARFALNRADPPRKSANIGQWSQPAGTGARVQQERLLVSDLQDYGLLDA